MKKLFAFFLFACVFAVNGASPILNSNAVYRLVTNLTAGLSPTSGVTYTVSSNTAFALRTLVVYTNVGPSYNVTNLNQITVLINTNGGGTATVNGDTNLPTYVATNLLAQTQRGISNVVYISARNDGRDGIGTFADPRDASSETKLSNIVWNARDGTHMYLMSGTYNVRAHMKTNVVEAEGKTNGPIKLWGKSNFILEGLGRPIVNVTNAGDIVVGRFITNIVIKGIVFNQNRPIDAGIENLYGVISYTGPTEGTTIQQCDFLNYGNHAITHWGVGWHNRSLIENNYFFNGGRTNHPFLVSDGTAVNIQASNMKVTGNTISYCLRGMEYYIYGTQVFPITASSVINNTISDVWEAGILCFNDRYDPYYLQGPVISGNSITMGTNLFNIVSGRMSGITFYGNASGLILAANAISTGNASQTRTAFGINVSPAVNPMVGVIIANNAITTGLEYWGFRGLQVYADQTTAFLSSVIVSGNTVADANTGILLGGVNFTVSDNAVEAASGANEAFSLVGLSFSSFVNNSIRAGSALTVVIDANSKTNTFQLNNWPFTAVSDSGTANVMNEQWKYPTFRVVGVQTNQGKVYFNGLGTNANPVSFLARGPLGEVVETAVSSSGTTLTNANPILSALVTNNSVKTLSGSGVTITDQGTNLLLTASGGSNGSGGIVIGPSIVSNNSSGIPVFLSTAQAGFTNIVARSGKRFKAINMVLRPGQDWYTYYSNDSFFHFVTNDIALATNLGFNAVRLISDMKAVYTNAITTNLMLSRYEFFVKHAATNGLDVYAVSGDGNRYLSPPTGSELLWTSNYVFQFSAMLSSNSNVRGLDIMQEIHTWDTDITELTDATNAVRAMYQASKVAVSSLPASFSMSLNNGNIFTANATTLVKLVNEVCDFNDLHIYVDPYPGRMYWLTNYTKPFIIGEIGVNNDESSALQTWKYRQAVSLSTHPQCEGIFWWALTDQNTIGSDMWGWYTTNNVLKGSNFVFVGRGVSAQRNAPWTVYLGSGNGSTENAIIVESVQTNLSTFYFNASRPGRMEISGAADINPSIAGLIIVGGQLTSTNGTGFSAGSGFTIIHGSTASGQRLTAGGSGDFQFIPGIYELRFFGVGIGSGVSAEIYAPQSNAKIRFTYDDNP